MLWRKYAKGLIFINQYRINLKWLKKKKKKKERKKGDRKKPVTLFIQRALRTDWRNTSITVWVLGQMERPERKVRSFSCLSFSSNMIGAGHCPPYQESGWGPQATHGFRGRPSARGSYQDLVVPIRTSTSHTSPKTPLFQKMAPSESNLISTWIKTLAETELFLFWSGNPSVG